MTPITLKAWRDRMRWPKTTAAKALGISTKALLAYETGKPIIDKKTGSKKIRPIPRTVALACAAITHRLEPEE